MAEDLETRLLRRFVVADELHFGRAADRLFIAPQALSRDIRRLEDTAGVRLLDRSTRRVTLTPEGERLLGRARELIALHDRALRDIRTDLHAPPPVGARACRRRGLASPTCGGLDSNPLSPGRPGPLSPRPAPCAQPGLSLAFGSRPSARVAFAAPSPA